MRGETFVPGNGTLSSTFGGVALLIGAGLLSFAPKAILAAEPGAIPVLTPDAGSLWVPDRAAGDDFLPPKSGPGPIDRKSTRLNSSHT